jgi:ATP-dependent NAD(P)H-hydrate dehydratase
MEFKRLCDKMVRIAW